MKAIMRGDPNAIALVVIMAFVGGAAAIPLDGQEGSGRIPMQLSAQPAESLAALTVPVERLAVGCRLEPVDPYASGAARFVMSPGVRENPWIGTRRPTVSFIRRVVDGPSGPTYGLRPGPALNDRLADGVAEGYRARYVSPEHRVEVYAVRFNDPALTLAASLNRLARVPPEPPRIVFGATAVLVLTSRFRNTRNSAARAEGEDCLQSVTKHIAALK